MPVTKPLDMKSSPNLTRQQRWLQRQQGKGLVRCEVRVPAGLQPVIRRAAAALREGSTIQIAPPREHWSESMEQIDTPWRVDTLKEALESGDLTEDGEMALDIIPGAEPVLRVRMQELGDLQLFVSVSGEQVLTSVLLWPRDDQDDPNGFEAMMLRNHKRYLPLAALGITAIDGREWYELFGSMSARSTLASIVTELRTIGQNAVDLSGDIGPKAAT